MEENSKKMKSGLEKAPHRSLLYALGLTREEMERPLVGVVNAASEVVPGHLHLGKLAEAVKAGVRMAGGTPLEFPAIAVCDGIAMNHEGMRFSLPSREFIADSIEIMARAHAFDALVFIPNCDKCVPGMLMAMMRLNIPSVLVSGCPMLPGTLTPGKQGDLITLFEGVGRVRNGCRENVDRTIYVDTQGNLSPCVYVNLPTSEDDPKRRIFARAEYGRPAGELAGLWRTKGFRDFRAALAGPWPDLPCAGCSKRFEKIW